MSQTYSTVNREMAAGRVYSTQRSALVTPTVPRSRAALPSAAPAPAPQAPAPQAPALPPTRRRSFQLNPMGRPGARQGQPGLTGAVRLEGRFGEPYRVEGLLAGLPPSPDPAVQPVLWLIHDLTVPTDLDPADLAALPRGSGGSGNQPGSIFTLDGNPPTYGPQFNTLSIAVSPGRFTPAGAEVWRLDGQLDASTNLSFHPLYFAGPEALADPNQPVPSGTLARILTDLFMRPATVHPEFSIRTEYLPRLKAVTARHLAGEPSLLDGSAFTRAAVTLEGIIRPTPTLMPTRENCILLAHQPQEG
ncbi:MAG: hypothetical protein ACOY93_02075 [Bacillota bacterium]